MQRVVYRIQQVGWAMGLVIGLSAAGAEPGSAQILNQLLVNGIQIMQISNLSDQQEVALGQEIDQQLQRDKFQISQDRSLTQWVNQIGQRLAQVSQRPSLPFTFQVLEDPQMNAFATMGGFVYITRGAIQAADHEDQVAAVLAHEIAHITSKHALQQVQQAMVAEAGADLLGVGNSRLASVGLELALNRPTSREHELAADREAVSILHRAGYDPRALPQFLAKLLSQPQLPELFSTHPPTPTRLAQLDQLVASYTSSPSPPTSSVAFSSQNPIANPAGDPALFRDSIPEMPVLPGVRSAGSRSTYSTYSTTPRANPGVTPIPQAPIEVMPVLPVIE